MRKKFSSILHDKMGKDERLFLLTGDLGYGLISRIDSKILDHLSN